MSEERMTYKGAGVDINAGATFVDLIKPAVARTKRPGVIGGIGGFGGLFRLKELFKKYRDPVLVSGTDGVGTKLKLAFMSGKHGTVGVDLVAMCVNDILAQGAEPLFFLDYFATGKLEPEEQADVVKGIAEGCCQAGCALIGGETAEMPGFYSPGEYDVAGFAVGVVEYDQIIDGRNIKPGYKMIGLGSSGLHSNGYSLARKVMEKIGLSINDIIPGIGKTVAEELLTPTKIYVKTVLSLLEWCNVAGIAHITGGGLTENIPRVLPKGCAARIEMDSWERPAIFNVIQENGNVEEAEMRKTFNLGIGMILIVPSEEAGQIIERLGGAGEEAYEIGEIVETTEEPHVQYA